MIGHSAGRSRPPGAERQCSGPGVSALSTRHEAHYRPAPAAGAGIGGSWAGWNQGCWLSAEWYGGLRADGDGAAGVELLQLAFQLGLLVLWGFPPGVEVGAQVLVWGPGLEDLVGDLEQGVRDRGEGFLLRGRVLVPAEAADQPAVPACSRPRSREPDRASPGRLMAGPVHRAAAVRDEWQRSGTPALGRRGRYAQEGGDVVAHPADGVRGSGCPPDGRQHRARPAARCRRRRA